MSVPAEVTLDVLVHRTTGVLMALSDDLPGFVVHASSEDELERKIPFALQSFIRATRNEETKWHVVKNERAPGFGPPAFIAHRASFTSKAA